INGKNKTPIWVFYIRFNLLFNFSLFFACFASHPKAMRRTTTMRTKRISIIHFPPSSSFCSQDRLSYSLPKFVRGFSVGRIHSPLQILLEGSLSFQKQTSEDSFRRCQFSNLPGHSDYQTQKTDGCDKYTPNLGYNSFVHYSSWDQL